MLKNEPALRERLAVTLTGQRVDRAAASIQFNVEEDGGGGKKGHPVRSFVLDYGFVTRVTRVFGSSKKGIR